MARYRRLCHLVGLLLLICATSTALTCPNRGLALPGREIACYTSSQDLRQLENAVCRCTTLVHQGHDLQSLDASELKTLRDGAKEANPDIKILFSITDKNELLKNSATTRQEAAAHLIEILKEVDGVELNVTTGSKDRLVSFVKSLKDELVNKSMDKMILLALPTKPEDLAKQFELKELSKYVDIFTVATHYLRDKDEAYLTFHPSRLMGLFDMLNTDSIVDLISGMGAPKQKILISVPTSAYNFTLKKSEENTPRSSTVEENPNALDRKKLCDTIKDGEWTVERDEDLTAPYAFKNTTWIAFEDETSLKIKGKYVILRELAGLALRDIENDVENDCGGSVAQLVYQAFTEMRRKTREVVLSLLEKDLKGTEIAYPSHIRSSDYRIVRVIDTAGKIRAVRENTQTAFTCSRQGYFVHPKSCNRFYRCVKFNQDVDDYSVFEFDCPAGLAFDERTEVCVWPGSLSKGSACPGSSEIEPVPRTRFRCPDHPGFYADPQNCRWFFACYDLGGPEMVPYEFRCPFGLVFDEQRLICEWPWKVPNCNGPEHGGDHSVYNYGGNYNGQGEHIQQEGIFSQGEFVGHAGQNIGVNYEDQNYNAAGGAGYNKQIYNSAGAAGSGAEFNEQVYGTAGSNGAGIDFKQQNFNGASIIGSGANFDGQIYSTGIAGESQYGPIDQTSGQTFNSAGVVETGQKYNGQTYNADGVSDGRLSFDSHSLNSAGVSGTGSTYNTDSIGDGVRYEGPAYNSAGVAGAGSTYDGQIYETNGANSESSSSFGDNRYNGETSGGRDESQYNEQNFNGNIANTAYEGQVYNQHGIAVGNKEDCNDKNYNSNKVPVVTDIGKEADVNTNGFNSQNVNTDSTNYDKGIAIESADYDDQRGGAVTSSFNGQANTFANGDTRQTTQFNSINSGSSVDANNLGENTHIPTSFTNSPSSFSSGVPSTSDYAGGAQSVYASGETNGYKTGVTNVYATDERNRNAEGATNEYATGGINRYASNNEYSAGSTTEYADLNTKQSAGATGVSFNFNNDAGQNDISRVVTPQNELVTNEKFGTNFISSTNDFNNKGFTNTPGAQNTIYNAFDNKGQAGFFNNINTDFSTGFTQNKGDEIYNTGLSTLSYSNTINGQNIKPVIYNSSYSANSGYPTSTIIPFAERQNTFDQSNDKGSTFNSVIYHSHVAMGLSSTDHFGTQYTNQAAKSFITQGQTANGFVLDGRTQNAQKFNTETNVYSSNAKLTPGVTPPISFIRDGLYNAGNTITENAGFTSAGATNFRDSSNTANLNTNAGVTNAYGTSAFPNNNDIVTFRETTGLTDNFNGNTANTNFKSDNSIYNQQTVTNQNGFISTAFAKTPAPNTIARGQSNQNLNNQGQTISGVQSLNNIQPAVELDNSGLFGANIAGSTTPIFVGTKTANLPSTTLSPALNSGYKTNEYFDNGGRGTIRYNNGIVANKETGNDIQDYRTPSYTSIPNSFIINGGNGENPQSTIQKFDSTDSQQLTPGTYTREGFTKTGPTRTGITTAQVGGSGTYVIGTGIPRAKPNPQLIGEHAFAGNFGGTRSQTNSGSIGTTNFATNGQTNFESTRAAANFGTRGTQNNFILPGTTTNFGGLRGQTNVDSIGTTNFGVTGGQTNFDSIGTTNFGSGRDQSTFVTGNQNNFVATGTTLNFGSRGSTTQLNMKDRTNFAETASTAEFGTSQLSNDINTASRTNSETEGYSYPRPLVQLEIKGITTTPGVTSTNFFDVTTPSPLLNTQTFTKQNSLIPNIQNNKGFSTTLSPIGFTTNQLENFKTTVYQAVNVPQTVSTVQPVIDNGFRTVISSTPIPAISSTLRQPYQPDDLSTKPKSYLDVGVSFDQGNDYYSLSQGSAGNSDYSDYTANLDQGNFGQKVTGQTKFSNDVYQTTKNTIGLNPNNELITSSELYGQTEIGLTDQTGNFRTNQVNDLGSTVTIPKQVYLPSSTIAPEIGVTFRKPIIAAEFSQNQADRSSSSIISQNNNVAEFNSKSAGNRILSNQAPANFASQRTANRGSINQVSTNFNSQGLGSGFSNSQTSTNFVSQGSNQRLLNNQASGNFISKGLNNQIPNNQDSNSFTFQGSISNQASADFASQRLNTRISNNQVSFNSASTQNQGLNGQTRTLIGSNVVTSIGGADFNSDIIRQNIQFNGADSFSRLQQSTTTRPEVTTYSGTFNRPRSRTETNAAFNSQNQNKKVIVKLSDLHPLILGKLGAECTCKADPFAVFRSPNRQTLPINSQNRGPVDLANYDESDIYVDIDSDKENAKELDFIRNIPSNRLIKTSNNGLIDENNKGIIVSSRGEPASSTYLPPTTRTSSTSYLPPARTSSTTYLPPASTSPTTYLPPARSTPTTYLPPTKLSNAYLPSDEESIVPVLRENQVPLTVKTQNRQPLLIRVAEDNSKNSQIITARGRSGKALVDEPRQSPNNLRNQGTSFDRYGPGGLRSNDETLQGELDCARPGLFRHPKFCNKFYACHWDSWKKRYTLHVFNCPVHLAFDSNAGACNYPTKGPACQDNKLLI